MPLTQSSDALVERPCGVRVRDLTIQYQQADPVLRNLDLEVAPGEIVALVGASGCGKSTLLRAIAGLIEPAAGCIEFESGGPNRRLGDLAFVFQDPTLLPWRNVYENVRLPFELGRGSQGGPASSGGVERRNGSTQDQIIAALRSVELPEESWSRWPRELSGGMRMRTSIARALVTDPNVLLLDEPFAALDDILRSKLNELLLSLWEQRTRTILFVTHNIAEAVFLSHRVAVFGRGSIATVHNNELSWPRSAHQRTTQEFAEQYGAISGALAEATQ